MAPSSEKLTFNGDTDARKFFYVYENIVQKEATPMEKAERVVQHLTEKASIYTTTSSFVTIPPLSSRRTTPQSRQALSLSVPPP